jgi:hypothetical protein
MPSARDLRLYATVSGVSLLALGLAVLLALPVRSSQPQPSRHFLGLDEPVEATQREP